MGRTPFIVVAGALIAGCANPPQPAVVEQPYFHPDVRTYADFVKVHPSVEGVKNEIVTLKNESGVVKVSLVGANVFSYVPAGGEEVLFRAANYDFFESDFQHVGIPIVWPWFGMNGAAGTPCHSFVRQMKWTVVEKSEGAKTSRLVLELVSSIETRRHWPYDFRLRYAVTLGDQLELTLATENRDTVPFAITEGFHAYFNVSDVNSVVLRGLDGRRNDQIVSHKYDPVFRGDLRFAAGEGRVFAPGEGEYVLFDEGKNRALALAARGNRKLILWSIPQEDSNGRWFGPEDWKHFVCLEPSTISRESAITVLPGKQHELQMSVKAAKL